MFSKLVIINLIMLLTMPISLANFSTALDGEWVTLTGKIAKATPDGFYLQANGRRVWVEMDDFDVDADGLVLKSGDNVIVTGKIDQDFLEKKKVEAGSVYVKSLNTYFYANSADEEGIPYLSVSYYSLKDLPENTSVDLQGKITKISGREFVLNTGLREITVDTKGMIFNPMDSKGMIKLNKGDKVRVSGIVDDSFFEGKEISAISIIELNSKEKYSE